jgi:phospholipid/cholesterol/gamma-HCH transport system substrate-binding protein
MAELEIKPTRQMILKSAALIFSAAAIVGVLVWLLTGGGVGLFEKKVELKSYLPDATGLGVGGQVRMDGIQIGKVKSIAISGYRDGQRSVRVQMQVEEKYIRNIPADSLTSLGSDTLIGEKFLNIDEGKSLMAVAAGGELRSEPADTAADKADLIYGIQDSLKKIDTMLIGVASPDTPIGHYFMGEKEYDSMVGSVNSLEHSLRAFAATSSPMGQTVFSAAMATHWDETIHKLDDTLQSIQKGEGAAGKLYASDEQYNNILKQVKDLRKSIAQVRADVVKMGPGLRDEESYRKLTRMLASTDSMLAALNRGEGQMGDLLTNPQLYESLTGSLKNMQEFLKEFDNNPRKFLRLKVF